MQEEIVNRVASSALITLDLEDYYPEGDRVILDIQDWLFEGIVLKEKDFRAHVAAHSWEQYQNAYVALHCSTDAIVPAWAFMLITTKLQPFAKQIVLGDAVLLETVLYRSVIEALDVSSFNGKSVIIKGCSHKPVPENAYIWATQKLQGVAKSIMYGEACSSVPLYKKK
jgi:S-adenosylmethionine/arginine decarboxylase-like enzyme